MKIKKGFVLRQVGGQYVAVATGSDMVDFNAMISTNESGAFLWNIFADGSDDKNAAEKLAKEYGIDFDTALADTKDFIVRLENAGLAE